MSDSIMKVVAARRNPTEFVVELQYREPGYEARTGQRSQPFRFRYRISASSEAQARWLALEEFRRITELSSVGWIREVVRVDVIRVIGT